MLFSLKDVGSLSSGSSPVMQPTVCPGIQLGLSTSLNAVGLRGKGSWRKFEYAHAAYTVGSNKVPFLWPKRFLSYINIHYNMAGYLVSLQAG